MNRRDLQRLVVKLNVRLNNLFTELQEKHSSENIPLLKGQIYDTLWNLRRLSGLEAGSPFLEHLITQEEHELRKELLEAKPKIGARKIRFK
jgi:hypothetical protein